MGLRGGECWCSDTLVRKLMSVEHPTQSKYQWLRMTKGAVRRSIVKVSGATKLLKLAGFRSDGDAEYLRIAGPWTMEELQQLTDVWLVLQRTQWLW